MAPHLTWFASAGLWPPILRVLLLQASPNKMPDGSTKIDYMKKLGADEAGSQGLGFRGLGFRVHGPP